MSAHKRGAILLNEDREGKLAVAFAVLLVLVRVVVRVEHHHRPVQGAEHRVTQFLVVVWQLRVCARGFTYRRTAGWVGDRGS